eukprot:TRINITY_DN6477_c0_g1_i1.p2 TRINITY_DN6477_c0_g1~~TRINITY_DN6477_c0_g1_i1.p2  ORF type:complete len:107 (-),score=17.52 TRINITY_DN6477_c0_g1_i1:485-805(-)
MKGMRQDGTERTEMKREIHHKSTREIDKIFLPSFGPKNLSPTLSSMALFSVHTNPRFKKNDLTSTFSSSPDLEIPNCGEATKRDRKLEAYSRIQKVCDANSFGCFR